MSQSVTAQESSDESDSEDCPDLLSWGKVAEAADTMKTFLIQHNAANGDAWEHVCKAENMSRNLFLNSMKQKKIFAKSAIGICQVGLTSL